MRRGIVSCLEQHPNLEVVGEAGDGEEALRKAKERVPDVLLTDIDMPHMTGLAVAEALHKELPQIKVLLLSMHTNAEFVLAVPSRAPWATSSSRRPRTNIPSHRDSQRRPAILQSRRCPRGPEPVGSRQRAGPRPGRPL